MSFIFEDVIKEEQIKLSHADVKKSLENIFKDVLKEEDEKFKRITSIFDLKSYSATSYHTKLNDKKVNKSNLDYNNREDFSEGSYSIENPITQFFKAKEQVA